MLDKHYGVVISDWNMPSPLHHTRVAHQSAPEEGSANRVKPVNGSQRQRSAMLVENYFVIAWFQAFDNAASVIIKFHLLALIRIGL